MHFSHSRINKNCHLKVINVTMFTLNKRKRAGHTMKPKSETEVFIIQMWIILFLLLVYVHSLCMFLVWCGDLGWTRRRKQERRRKEKKRRERERSYASKVFSLCQRLHLIPCFMIWLNLHKVSPRSLRLFYTRGSERRSPIFAAAEAPEKRLSL